MIAATLNFLVRDSNFNQIQIKKTCTNTKSKLSPFLCIFIQKKLKKYQKVLTNLKIENFLVTKVFRSRNNCPDNDRRKKSNQTLRKIVNAPIGTNNANHGWLAVSALGRKIFRGELSVFILLSSRKFKTSAFFNNLMAVTADVHTATVARSFIHDEPQKLESKVPRSRIEKLICNKKSKCWSFCYLRNIN